jgi:hypothetical protein
MFKSVVAAAAMFIAAPALAQPPSTGTVGQFPEPSILCDTSDQVQSILDAFEQSVEAGTERFAQLFEQLNHLREPTCAITPVRVGLTVSTDTLGLVDIGGATFYAWIVHIENGAGEAAYLYLETPQEALKNSV